MMNMSYEGDAVPTGGLIELTLNKLDLSLNRSVGRASYAKSVRLWDSSTGRLTDFTTQFSFIIKPAGKSVTGDGLSFFIAPFDSTMPKNSSGRYLGLFDPETAFNASLNQIVAVEFDTYKNYFDPSDNHVGINVNSIVSVANVTAESSIKNKSTINVWVSYHSNTKNLSVFLSHGDNSVLGENLTLSHTVDLSNVLPEWVRVGFSASTGTDFELHQILSWSFNSTLETKDGNGKTIDSGNSTKPEDGNRKDKVGLVIGLSTGFGLLSFGLGLLYFIYWRRPGVRREDLGDDICMDDEFEKGTGPRRFTYRELTRATNNFAEEGKLGQGGFGGVYKGLLSESKTEVAVKRVSKGSKQGKKEYMSEVRIISRLRHRNLVLLIGWCHEQSDLLLVYEYMPNGSLDSHLFRRNIILTWPIRFKIAIGSASSLLYLHEEWEQCVVHRDIKSSNIMLDVNFNAKLGDFGLARLVDHELGSQTTVLAGTLGYLAPECATTGRATKESDVYSFGIVCLEIACGRKAVEPREEPSKVSLSEWVWELYRSGQLLEAVDQELGMEFDEQQIECLMTVGLWCCHLDPTVRPSIRQVINILNFEAPLPDLPPKLSMPSYFTGGFSYTSSSYTSSTKDQTQCTSSSSATHSSMFDGVEKALLYSGKSDA